MSRQEKKAREVLLAYGEIDKAISFTSDMANNCYKTLKNMAVFWYEVKRELIFIKKGKAL